MSDVAIFAAGIATMSLSLTLLVGLFPRLFFAEHDRQVAERAWDEGWEASERYGYPTDEDDSYENPYRAAKGEQK